MWKREHLRRSGMAELRAWARSAMFRRTPNRTVSHGAPNPTALPIRVTQSSQDQQVRGGCRALRVGTGWGLGHGFGVRCCWPRGTRWAGLGPHWCSKGPLGAATPVEATDRDDTEEVPMEVRGSQMEATHRDDTEEVSVEVRGSLCFYTQ